MTGNSSGINVRISMDGNDLEAVTSIKYLSATLSDKGSEPEFLSRIAQTTFALKRLKPPRMDSNMSTGKRK